MVGSVKICAFKLGFLKEAITAKRKEMKVTGPKGRVALMELLEAHKRLPGVAEKMTDTGNLDSQSVAQLCTNPSSYGGSRIDRWCIIRLAKYTANDTRIRVSFAASPEKGRASRMTISG